MATIRIRGDSKDIEIKSITYENSKIVKQVILPQGDFLKNEIKETIYFTNIKIPGKEVEVEIVGTEKNDDGNVFYKNYNISNNIFNSEENPTVTMSFETNISDIYKIKITSFDKTPGNMINPGKTIHKIYNLDYKFNFPSNLEVSESEVSILKTDFSSNINLTDNEEENNNGTDNEEELEEDEDESDNED
jgi:hypothetical protein